MKTIHNTRIPNQLRKCRKARGLRQYEVARILGFTDSSLLSRWERGLSLPSAGSLFRLAALYRTLVDTLYIDLLRDIKGDVLARERHVLAQRRRDGESAEP